MEDFGYVKDENKKDLSRLSRKIALSCATLFSISCFIYITINAYYYVYEEETNIETIKSPEGPIKVIEEDEVAIPGEGPHINNSIYEDIFGNKKESLAKAVPKIRISPQPAIPPKNVDNVINENVPNFNNTDKETETQKQGRKQVAQPIIVFNDKPRETNGSQDFLTKGKTDQRNTNRKLSDQNLDKSKNDKRRFVRVQIAALTSKKSADDYWNKINNSQLFSGLKPLTEEVNLGKKGIFYRLQIGNFSDQIEAENFCKRYTLQLHKNKADCIVVE